MGMKRINKAEYERKKEMAKPVDPKALELYVWLMRMCYLAKCAGRKCKGCQYDRAYLRGESWE